MRLAVKEISICGQQRPKKLGHVLVDGQCTIEFNQKLIIHLAFNVGSTDGIKGPMRHGNREVAGEKRTMTAPQNACACVGGEL